MIPGLDITPKRRRIEYAAWMVIIAAVLSPIGYWLWGWNGGVAGVAIGVGFCGPFGDFVNWCKAQRWLKEQGGLDGLIATLGERPELGNLETLLESATDFELADATCIKIIDRYGGCIDVQELSEVERVVALVWQASGIIGNGGFEYLFSYDFEGDLDYGITFQTFKTLGLTRSVEAIEQAKAVFPDGQVPKDREERSRLYLSATTQETRMEVSSGVWDDDETREKLLAQYIRDNIDAFSDLDGED